MRFPFSQNREADVGAKIKRLRQQRKKLLTQLTNFQAITTGCDQSICSASTTKREIDKFHAAIRIIDDQLTALGDAPSLS